MNTYINPNIYGITAESFERYLVSKGWSRDKKFKNFNLMVFNYRNLDRKIALPSSEKLDDFYIKLNDILKTIAIFENRTKDEIIKELLSVYFDKLEFRIISEISKNGKLPLDYASNCIEGLKELILYSACAENNAVPVCQRATPLAQNILNNFNLAQTEVGSFVINIDIKVVDEKKQQLAAIGCEDLTSFEHRIVKRINTAFHQVEDAIENKKSPSSMAETAFEKGITANMCEAFLKMKPERGDIEINTIIRYASAISTEANTKNEIKIKNNHFWFMDELAKIYRDKTIYQDVILNGFVKMLSKKNIENTIHLHTKYEGKYRSIMMVLSDAHYRIACNSHRDELEVEVSGELDMSKRNWVLTKISDFKLVK